jgi:hypothetical protein
MLRLAGARRLPGAHASAVRGLAWAGASLLFSAGLDQRIYAWAALDGEEGGSGASSAAHLDAPWFATRVASGDLTAPGTVDLMARWRAQASESAAGGAVSLLRLGSAVTAVCDTEALCAVSGGSAAAVVAVAGHGAQLWRWSGELDARRHN